MILALLGALCIGLSLGLLGSGGSILTVPALVYLVGHPEKQAIAESLAIVGGIAAVGAMPRALRGDVHWKSVILFGGPGMVGAAVGAWVSLFVAGWIQLLVFSIVMLSASATMLHGRGDVADGSIRPPRAAWKIMIDGLLVGGLTGFVGVGGGFLIVPALVLLGGLPMRIAIGTSLCVIALNCVVGFVQHARELPAQDQAVDWTVIAVFLAIGIVGSLAGNAIGTRIHQRRLRRWFGIVLLLMGAFVLAHQLITRFA